MIVLTENLNVITKGGSGGCRSWRDGHHKGQSFLLETDTTQLFITTSNFIGPWYHAALLFSGLGSIVLLFVLLSSQQIREDLVRAAKSAMVRDEDNFVT